MKRPLCATCGVEMQVARNGVSVLEYNDAEKQVPEALWRGDLDRCPKCGATVVASWASGAVMRHFEEGFAELVEKEREYNEDHIAGYGFPNFYESAPSDEAKHGKPVECPIPACDDTVEEPECQPTITKDEIKDLVLRRSLTLTNVIDVVCELNGFVGVGYITFGDQIGEYIKDKARTTGLSAEAWMNS